MGDRPVARRRDERIKDWHRRLLNVMGEHVDEWGRLWPTAQTLAAECRRSRRWVFLMLRDLTTWEYLVKLEWWDYPWLIREAGLRKGMRWPALRQVRFTADLPKPPTRKFKKAQPPLDSTLHNGQPWVWRPPVYTPKGEVEMENHQTVEINDEKLLRRAQDAEREARLFAACQRVAQYFADRRGAATGEGVAASYSEPTAKKWLGLGFTEPELREHINLLIAEWRTAGLDRSRFPYSLADRRVRAPQRAA